MSGSFVLPWWYHALAIAGGAVVILQLYRLLWSAAAAGEQAWRRYRRRRRLARSGYGQGRPDAETDQLWRQTRHLQQPPRFRQQRLQRLTRIETLSPAAQDQIYRELAAATRPQEQRT